MSRSATPLVIGVDLGTTHCAMAFVRDPGEGAPSDKTPSPEVLSIPQLTGPGALESRPLLPSFLYLPHPTEGAQALPWDAERAFVVGEYARSRGVEAASRLVSSAKSWLSHAGVDRHVGILPPGAPEDVEKISPVEASWRYLEHLSEAFDQRFRDEGIRLNEQEVVITVPASFDASARELTVEAALAAGIDNVILLEEPQAALYAWLDQMGSSWRKHLFPGDVVLVIDVGGGTTDFSAIAAVDDGGTLELTRVAVGEHILLGGDNMDLAIAHLAKNKLTAAGKEVDKWQMIGLQHAGRLAKEALLSGKAQSFPVAVASKGARLLGGSLRTDITAAEIEATIVNGFFPEVPLSARPAVRARGALTQIGLPYASDPAVTKHLAAFLGRQAGALAKIRSPQTAHHDSRDRQAKLLHPTAVLWNGGVMKAPALRKRVIDTLNAWLAEDGAPAVRELPAEDLDLAVARGAAAYGLVRRGKGLRIRGGTARAYYVGIEGAVPAVPGVEPPIVAMCVAPFGMEEGSSAALPPHELGVVVGEPVRFRFFGSTVRREDRAGTEVESWREGEIEELSPIEVTLPAEGRAEGDVVPVKLDVHVTDIGTLLVEAVPHAPKTPNERWRVELSVRSEG